MHIHFVAIGGAGIGPLAQIAHKAGYQVSGSDIQDSQYIEYLISHGISDIQIGQSEEQIAAVHQRSPIDWVVYSSAVTMVDPNPPILNFCKTHGIKFTKRDEFINKLTTDHNLKMIAVAGTHGKTTTTAMLVWLFKQFNQPISYLLPAKTSYAEMGDFDAASEYFIYEADEFDRNFLAFSPFLSLITGVSWDHHEIYPTREDYKQAFNQFISSSDRVIIWQSDVDYLKPTSSDLLIQDTTNKDIEQITLKGQYNRYDGWLVTVAVKLLLDKSLDELIAAINLFPGLSRRMEEVYPNLFSDYAHTPEKIRAAMSVALEVAKERDKSLAVIYEPLTNRRQIHILEEYRDCFNGAKVVYWLPSYLAREDPSDRVIEPEELIAKLDDPSIAIAARRDQNLENSIIKHLTSGDMVVGLAGGGGSSLDDWLRDHFKSQS